MGRELTSRVTTQFPCTLFGFRLTDRLYGKNDRPLTLDHATPLRQTKLDRSKAVPPRPFSEIHPDRFAATPALCTRLAFRTYLFLGILI